MLLRPLAAMPYPFTAMPAALPQGPSALSLAAPYGTPQHSFVYRSTCTARSSSAANLAVKGALLVALTVVVGFALPPTFEPTKQPVIRSRPGGLRTDPFQVGSGAYGSDPELPHETPVTEGELLMSPGNANPSATRRLFSSTSIQKIFTHQRVTFLTGAGLAAAILAIVMHMMAGAAAPAPRDFNYRVPPAWSPENDTSYSFRAFITDISLWIMLTDL